MTSMMETWWMGRDYRDWYAAIRYILFRCCKKANKKYKLGEDIEGWERSIKTEYLPMDYMDFKWIVDRCNFELGKAHGIELLPYSFADWYEEAHFVPEYFDADFTCDYKKDKNGKWRKVKRKTPWTELDFLSQAEIWAMNKIIRRWKLYGRWCVKISNWWYCLKWKIKNKTTKQK